MTGEEDQRLAECLVAGGRALKPPLTYPKVNQLNQLSSDWKTMFKKRFPPGLSV
jgi:hypothetical protein